MPSADMNKELLTFIVDATPDTMFGKPGSNSSTLWWSLQQRLENHLYDETPATGVVSDVVKAFNHLPREPVFAIAAALGTDTKLLKAWAASTCSLQRHFFVQGPPSMPVSSCTGFVEGCGLSVASMALINMLIHKFLEWSCPTATFTSYVDNYEIEADTIQAADQALAKLDAFCDLLDVQLDKKKTCWWAIQPEDRQGLRTMQRSPMRAARDLGGHIQYTGQQGNATVIQRVRDLDDLWPKLAASSAPRKSKVRILRTVAWPRGLFGSSITHIGANHFDHLRAQAMKALGYHKAGANSQIQLSLIEAPNVDPEFVVLLDSIIQLRRQAGGPEVESTCAACVVLPDRQKKPGPIGVLITRLNSISWQYIGGTRFYDGEGLPIDLLHTCIQEIKHRVARCWAFKVGGTWQHRKDFQGLHKVSPSLSRPHAKHDAEAAGVLRCLMNGTLFTNDFQAHYEDQGSKQCPLCGADEDSVHRRHWECKATLTSREQISEEIQQLLPTLPACTANRGWIQEPSSLQEFRASLHTIPDTTAEFASVEIGDRSILDIFSDGTGLDPGNPSVRLVAWAAIIAAPTMQDNAQSLSKGGVPGQWQTVVRAELTGILSALQFAAQQQVRIRIWCDNEAVVNRARNIQQGTFVVTNKIADHDLWFRVADILSSCPPCEFQQIRSYQQTAHQPEWKVWAFSHNNLADAEAAYALRCLPWEVRRCQSRAAQDVTFCTRLRDELRTHFARVGVSVVANKPKQQVHQQDTAVPPTGVDINFARVADHFGFHAPRNLHFEGINKVLDWMRAVTDENEPEVFMSWYEILADMQISTGIWGVESVSTHSTWRVISRGADYDAVRCCRVFSCFLTRVIRLYNEDFRPQHGRPKHHKFQCWAMGLNLGASKTLRRHVDCWLTAVFGSRQIESVACFAALEPATLDVDRTTVTLPRGGLHRFWG